MTIWEGLGVSGVKKKMIPKFTFVQMRYQILVNRQGGAWFVIVVVVVGGGVERCCFLIIINVLVEPGRARALVRPSSKVSKIGFSCGVA